MSDETLRDLYISKRDPWQQFSLGQIYAIYRRLHAQIDDNANVMEFTLLNRPHLLLAIDRYQRILQRRGAI